MTTQLSRLAGPLLALGTTIVALVITEIVLGVVAPVTDPYEAYKTIDDPNAQYIRSQFPRNLHLTTEAEEGLPGVVGKNAFSTNAMGFRGDELVMPKPADEYRIFIVGGSTTACEYLDDYDSIDAVVQRHVQSMLGDGPTVKVYNAGKSGDKSWDHVAMVAHRIVHLDPDLIVVFAGVNDLTAAIYEIDYLHFPNDVDRLSKANLIRFMLTETQLGRRVYYLLKRARPSTGDELLVELPLKSGYRERAALRKSAPLANRPPRTKPDFYRRNLLTVLGAAKEQGADLFLMTQQSTWGPDIDPNVEPWLWMLYRDGVTYDAAEMDRALESLNDVMRHLAHTHQVPLYDLAASLPKSAEFFYDDVHFNVAGARRAGEELGAAIVNQGLIPTTR